VPPYNLAKPRAVYKSGHATPCFLQYL